jgi:hypothetical protein
MVFSHFVSLYTISVTPIVETKVKEEWVALVVLGLTTLYGIVVFSLGAVFNSVTDKFVFTGHIN